MTEAQKRFCEEYLIDLNATRAYKAAYPNCKKEETASQSGSRLLRNVKVQNYITERQEKLAKKTEITQENVLKELAKCAFFDLKTIYDDKGNIKDIQELDNNASAVITSIETVEQFDTLMGVKVKTGEVKKVKLNDKLKALEMLARHLGMFNDKMDVTTTLKYEDYVAQVEDEEEY